LNPWDYLRAQIVEMSSRLSETGVAVVAARQGGECWIPVPLAPPSHRPTDLLTAIRRNEVAQCRHCLSRLRTQGQALQFSPSPVSPKLPTTCHKSRAASPCYTIVLAIDPTRELEERSCTEIWAERSVRQFNFSSSGFGHFSDPSCHTYGRTHEDVQFQPTDRVATY
jgi:hypothetical protein